MCASDFCVCVCVYFLLLLITHVCITGLEFESDDEIGRLSISIDFLVGLSDNVLAKVMFSCTKLPMKFCTDLCSLLIYHALLVAREKLMHHSPHSHTKLSISY